MEKIPVSVVVIVRNEEKRLAQCLESVAWSDDIVIVDDLSTDGTVEIARRYTDRVFEKRMEIEGAHRNYAYSLARNGWVLSLDADEVVTPELASEISQANRDDGEGKLDEYVVFAIPLRNFIGKYWVRWGGWYPAYKDRLFRKGRFKYEEVGVHPRVIYEGRCGRLKSDIIHYSYEDFSELIASMNGQTTKEAQKWVSDGRKMTLGKALWRALDRFLRCYFVKKGRRDGVIGLMVAVNSGIYQVLSYAKYWETNARTKA